MKPCPDVSQRPAQSPAHSCSFPGCPATACIALSALLLLAASPQSAAAALIPGTPLDGSSPTQQLLITLVTTTAPLGGAPYNAAPYVGADRAAPGDIVILTHISGNAAIDDNPTNWAAVARFFSPSDPNGSQGTDATEEIGFLPASTLAPTDFSTFPLFSNVMYVAATSITPDGVTASYEQFGPAGAIPADQADFVELNVVVPEPATAALLAIGAPLLLARRRRGRTPSGLAQTA